MTIPAGPADRTDLSNWPAPMATGVIEIERAAGMPRARAGERSVLGARRRRIYAAAGGGGVIQITPQMRILVAVEAMDFRKGLDSLARLCLDRSGTRSVLRRGSWCSGTAGERRCDLVTYDGQGFWLALQPTTFTLHLLLFDVSELSFPRRRVRGCGSVDKSVPSTGLLDWRIRPGVLVEPRLMAVIRMGANDTVLAAIGQGSAREYRGDLPFPSCQHSSRSKPIIARTQAIGVHEIGYALGGKASVVPSRSR